MISTVREHPRDPERQIRHLIRHGSLHQRDSTIPLSNYDETSPAKLTGPAIHTQEVPSWSEPLEHYVAVVRHRATCNAPKANALLSLVTGLKRDSPIL